MGERSAGGGVAAEREPRHELLPLRYSTGRWVSGMCQCVCMCVWEEITYTYKGVRVCVVNACVCGEHV